YVLLSRRTAGSMEWRRIGVPVHGCGTFIPPLDALPRGPGKEAMNRPLAAGSGNGNRIGAEHLDFSRVRLQLGQCRLHGCIFDMAGQIDEEAVFPLGLVRGPRLDAVHADAMPRERAEHIEQRAGLVM